MVQLKNQFIKQGRYYTLMWTTTILQCWSHGDLSPGQQVMTTIRRYTWPERKWRKRKFRRQKQVINHWLNNGKRPSYHIRKCLMRCQVPWKIKRTLHMIHEITTACVSMVSLCCWIWLNIWKWYLDLNWSSQILMVLLSGFLILMKHLKWLMISAGSGNSVAVQTNVLSCWNLIISLKSIRRM